MCLQDENTSNDNTKKLYLDLALKVLGNDVGWFAFQADESKITYQHIIDAILDQINGVSPKSTKDMEVIEKMFYYCYVFNNIC